MTSRNGQTENRTLAPQLSVSLEDIATSLKGASRVFACCHVHPDGDAIGSLLGFGMMLERLPNRPEVTVACADPVPEGLAFLPGSERIVTQPADGPWDVAVVLDASDPARLGSISPLISARDAPVIVLDHHSTNLRFGTVNYVDAEAAATAQILLSLFDLLELVLTEDLAVCLLTGIMTDTLGLRTSNVNAQVMAAALRLVQAGANIAEISRRTLDDRPLGIMRLWGLALSQVRLSNHVVWTQVTRDMRRRAGPPAGEDGHLVSHLITANEARVAAVFLEQEDDRIEVDLRARPGYDVSEVALRLGGGGHRQASGCTIEGPLSRARRRVLPLLRAAAQDRR